MSNLQHIKGSRTRVLNTFPTKTFGNDGDIVISRINGKGVFLCSKAGGMWYAANKMQELNKLEKTSIRELTTNKLTVNKMINTERSADRFVVNDGGSIKYRTGKQVVEDLPLPFDNIAYKTAYCSLGQYSDKDSCESNGGTWYYSENDSHDSISSTPENQLLTVGQSIGGVDAESTLTYDGSTLEIKRNSDFDDNWQTSAQTNLLKLSYDSSNNAIFDVDSSGDLTLDVVGDIELNADGGQVTIKDGSASHFLFDCDTTSLIIYDDTDDDDLFSITVGASGVTTIATVDDGAAVGHLTLQPDGDLILDPASQKTIINATDKLYFDGGDDTYIHEVSDDKIQFIVGDDGDIMLQLEEKGADGNEVSFGSSCVGFTQLEPTYDATDTLVDFRHSNKQFVTFGSGNITNLNLYFPLVSGNFVLLIKQDGTGSRTITNYKVREFDESLADGASSVKFAGGSNPTLTTDANHVDILSFYWDADNEIAYGVATLDFQF